VEGGSWKLALKADISDGKTVKGFREKEIGREI